MKQKVFSKEIINSGVKVEIQMVPNDKYVKICLKIILIEEGVY